MLSNPPGMQCAPQVHESGPCGCEDDSKAAEGACIGSVSAGLMYFSSCPVVSPPSPGIRGTGVIGFAALLTNRCASERPSAGSSPMYGNASPPTPAQVARQAIKANQQRGIRDRAARDSDSIPAVGACNFAAEKLEHWYSSYLEQWQLPWLRLLGNWSRRVTTLVAGQE